MVQFRGIYADPQTANGACSAGDDGTTQRERMVDSLVVSTRAGACGELLIVDPGIDDSSILVNGRRPDIEVFHLKPGGRGLEQIANHLSGLHGVTTLHLLCHGEPGMLVLAGDRIDLPALAVRRAVLADMAPAFGSIAGMALYGCSVAAGAAGMRFLDYLEAVLGVGVAASAGPVGAAALGGRWILRDRNGASVETAFTPLTRATYPGLLTVNR